MDIFFLLCTTSICGRGCSILFSSRSGRLFQFSITYELTLSRTKCLDLVLSILCKHQCSVTVDSFPFAWISSTATNSSMHSKCPRAAAAINALVPIGLNRMQKLSKNGNPKDPPEYTVSSGELLSQLQLSHKTSNLTIPRQRFDR
jgi:hypothetical protein